MCIKRIILMFFVLSAVSCTSTIDLELPISKEQLVVDAWFTNQQSEGGHINKLYLSKTLPINSNREYQPVTDAKVILIDSENNKYELTYIDDNIGLEKPAYVIKKNLEIGKSYSIYIKTKQGEEYLSDSQRMIKNSSIPKITIEEYEEDDDVFLKLIINNKFEPKSEPLYFMWKLIEENVFHDRSEYILGSNRYSGLNESQKIFEDIQNNKKYYVEQHLISKTSYDFYKLAKIQYDGDIGGMFSTQPAPLISNIKRINGSGDKNENPMGYFCIASVVKSNLVKTKK